MQFTRKHLSFGLLAVLAVMAAATLLGHPLIDPSSLAGLATIGAVPMVTGETEAHGQILEAIKQHAEGVKTQLAEQAKRLTDLEQLAVSRRSAFGGAHEPNQDQQPMRLKLANGTELPFLTKGQNLGNLYGQDDGGFSIGEYCRASILGSDGKKTMTSGPAIVPTALSAQVIDSVRANTVLVEAGAGTIVIEGPTKMARITSDPVVYQHTEGADDIDPSDVGFDAVEMNPKLLAVQIPLTEEVVQDSPNLDTLIQRALAGAFALKLDGLGIATLLADANIPDSASGQDPAKWLDTLAAVGSALALNQALPSAHISAPADMIARASQLASTAGTWLSKPPLLSAMRELQTTGLTAGTAIFGDFAAALSLIVRNYMRLEVKRWETPGKAEHLLIAHMRADFLVLQPGRLYRQLKTVA